MKYILILALTIPALAFANEKFIAKINVAHVDQFMATSLIEEGHCIAGVPFELKKGA
jgi:hypothetical protein